MTVAEVARILRDRWRWDLLPEAIRSALAGVLVTSLTETQHEYLNELLEGATHADIARTHRVAVSGVHATVERAKARVVTRLTALASAPEPAHPELAEFLLGEVRGRQQERAARRKRR